MSESKTSKRTICIADHDDDDRMLLHEAFLTLNLPFEIIEISTREELIHNLTKLSTRFPEFVFLNTSMPGMAEFQYVEAIRNGAGVARKIKIIIYCSDSDSFSIEKAFEMGVDFYAVKPNNYGDLRNLAEIIMDTDWETLKSDSRVFYIV